MAGKTGQYVKRQIKCLGLSLRLLATLRYTLSVQNITVSGHPLVLEVLDIATFAVEVE